MKDILYIGPYREFSTNGNASRKYIQALNFTQNNISIRPFYNRFKIYPEERIKQDILDAENLTKEKYDAVIQHVYPHQLSYSDKFKKNIGIITPECFGYGLDYSNYLSQMDAIIVPSDFSKRAILPLNIDPEKIHTVPVPIDLVEIDSFKNTAKTELDNKKYTFYVIDDFLSKNHIDIVILAYLMLSAKYKHISLIIKLSQSNIFTEDTIKENINNIYRLFPGDHSQTLPLILIGDTDHHRTLNLHNNSNCYIDVSSGKSFSYACLEAMAFNNNIITLENTAQSELVSDGCGLTVNGEMKNCLDEDKSFFMYNTVRQVWNCPILTDVINSMEKALLEPDSVKIDRIKTQDNKIANYTMKIVAELFGNII